VFLSSFRKAGSWTKIPVSHSPAFDLDRLRQTSFVAHVEWHDLISSTNDRGMKLAGDRAIATPYLILAGQQTAGRGRGTNRWWSDAGALTFSLVFDPQADQVSRGSIALEIGCWPRLALVAGVALCDLLQDSAPNSACGLKWPNDVLLAGQKVAGILVEVPPAAPPTARRIVLGMGMNVNNTLESAPPEVRSTGTSLFDATGDTFDLTDIIIGWLQRFADHLHHLAIGDPGLPFRWQSLCALSGKTVELQSGNRTVHGHCRGIDAEGALLVDTETGPERLYAGVLVRAV
jgi:BirA family biotin operon repressor/biotin-[acetyl-CoA-carboxylase] ligase